MPPPDDQLISDLQKALTSLEHRLESTQATARLEFDTFRNLLQEQRQAKDLRADILQSELSSLRTQNNSLYQQNIETLKSVNASFNEHVRSFQMQNEAANKQHIDMLSTMSSSFERHNEALQRQIGFRFNFVTGMIGVITLVLAATFVYNKYQVDKVEEAREILEKGSIILTDNTKKYAAILSSLAHADGLIADGNREYERAAYADTVSFSSSAVDLLEPALDTVGLTVNELRQSKFDAATCQTTLLSPSRIQVGVSGIKKVADAVWLSPTSNVQVQLAKIEDVFNPQSLQNALRTSLVQAHDLRNRARLFLSLHISDPHAKNIYIDNMSKDGQFLISLKASAWEGYHWVGVAAALRSRFGEAAACYLQSTKQKRDSNKDLLNLAELLFVRGEFAESREQAIAYVKTLGEEMVSPIQAVAHFFRIASNHLLPDMPLKNDNPEKYRDAGIESPNWYLNKRGELKIEGTFDPSQVNEYIDNDEKFAASVKEKTKRDEIRSMRDCLVNPKTCSKKSTQSLED